MSACEYLVAGYKPGSNKTFNSDIWPEDRILVEEVGSQLIADKVANVIHRAVRHAIRTAAGAGDIYDRLDGIVRAAIADATAMAASKAKNMFKPDAGGNPYLQGCIPNYVEYSSKTGVRRHPTEKPEDLLRFFVALYSRPDDVVLDPFGGSGAHAAAAVSLGRQAVIVEKDDEYFGRLTERLGLS